MAKSKLILTALLIVCTAWALTACNGESEPPDKEETSAESAPAVGDDVDTYTAVGRDAMARLGAALKTRLQEAMQVGGPIGALEACNVDAVPITETISIEEGVLVGRTSLRTRNSRNAPDDWERGILAAFEARRATGEKVENMDAWTIISDDEGHRTFRYMKAIPTAPICLTCHGESVAPDVAAKIAELYPEDTAVGFATGDIRGAFTVSKPLD